MDMQFAPQNTQNATRRIGVLLFERFSTFCLANAVEPLRAANMLSGRALYSWQYLGLTADTLTSSSGLPVAPESPLSHHPGGDLLLILPSYNTPGLATPQVLRALRAARRRFRVLVGLDMGSWLLAAAGLLDGRRATLHWDELDRFAETFPEVETCPDRVVDDGDILSCGGGTTAFELMLDLIGRHHGAMLRLEVAALFMHGERPMPPDLPARTTDDRQVEAAVALMRRNIEQPLPVAAIARRLGLSPRALERHFRAVLGQGPGATYRALRLNTARRLVDQSSLSVSEIAARCGYENASALTRAFRERFGAPPREVRRARPVG